MARKKKKEKVEIHEMTVDELQQELRESKDKLFEMKFQSATAPLKNPHLIRRMRRDIARIHTFLRQKGVHA